MEALSVYLPMDRQQALIQGRSLPDRSRGAALSVDISGFTSLTEKLAQTLGPQRGAEELTHRLNAIYDALIAEVHRYGGSVIGFSGDAFTSWFDQDTGLRAVAAAVAMQEAMPAVATVPLGGDTAVLAIRAAVATGLIRRFVLGDPHIQRIDAVAGRTLDLLAAADHLAEPGEVVVAEGAEGLDEGIRVSSWRSDPLGGLKVALVSGLSQPIPPSPWAALPPEALSEAELRPWILPAVYERLRSGQGQFMADLRPVTALFLAFEGVNYDDDDDAGILLDAYIRRVQATIARYEGSLIQLTFGDKGSYLYAAFGAPVAHDDDATNAVTAALELLKPPANLSFVHSIRIGLTQGQMYTGAYGSALRRTYGALGDKTNLAARLMQQAMPGQILCDEEVYQQAQRRWAFEALPSVRVKGKAGKVRVYTPTGQTAGTKAAPTAGKALVGRKEVVARLRTALEALKAGQGRVLFIEGEAGIGKSRLVQELIRHLRELGLSGLLGAGHSIEQQTPYRAWRDIFASYFALEGLGDALERQEQVRRVVQEVAPKLAQRLPLLNDLLNLGLPDTPLTAALDPALRQESLVNLLIQLLRSWAQERPLTVILEDAYWLDSLSWDLAVKVARALLGAGEPLLLVVVTRPIGEQSLGAHAATALRNMPGSQTLEVGALDVEETAALIADRLGLPVEQLPPKVARFVHERSGGNPFFAEELTYALREQGLIKVDPQLVVSPELFQTRSLLPDTLQGLVLSRIDRLLPDRQLTLKVASVIGRNYPYLPLRDSVMRLGTLNEALLHQHLQELIRRSLIMLEAPAPEPLYAFKHAITYEVTYHSLLFAQRRQIHRILAEWYEQFYTSNLEAAYPLLAHHWMHAAEGGDDAALTRKARDYLVKAGTQALRLCAYPEALSFLHWALSSIPLGSEGIAERAELIILIGIVHEKMADYAPAIVALEEALELARSVSDARLQSQALSELSWIAVRKGEYVQAEQLGEQALELATQVGDKLANAKAGYRLGIVAFYQGDYPLAARRFEESLAMSQELGDRYGVAGSLNTLGLVALYQGSYTEATRCFEEALTIGRELGNRDAIGKFLGNLGLVAEKQGNYPLAIQRYEESLSILREIGARHAALLNVLNLGDVATAQGDDAKAEQYYHEALAEALSLSALPIALGTLRGMAKVLARNGLHLRAAELLGLALSHPASDVEMRQQAEPVLSDLRMTLSPEQLEASMARGKGMTLEGVLRQWTHEREGSVPHAQVKGRA
ncbi:tetratricopeptide repeat protein [Meiothermus sp.]|uniref:tetratricopeptide repeat protein n=1 Tax=Meiothermus sp. TaxID=1955249 RepID=UPI0021DBF14B|nr:adenylate/guanylate cyclase domain-containing protein [Meiothermus sp.]GIW24276.1 MAG: adenylyl cyclase [Meiothermus sp.]